MARLRLVDFLKEKRLAIQADATIDDGRWVPVPTGANYLTTCQDGNANASFVDAHVGTVNWTFGTLPANTVPTQ